MTAVTQAYLSGALSLGCAATTLFFLRYYALARDPLFLWFAGAFVALGAQWTVLAYRVDAEHAHVVYAVRLVAFLLIAIGVLRKNRRGGSP